MSDKIVLTLEDGSEIVVEAAAASGYVPVARGESRVKASAEKLLRAPMTGMAKLFLATLPKDDLDAPYQLDEFQVKFGVELEVTGGSSAGVVATIAPTGSFMCTYTWKRKPDAV